MGRNISSSRKRLGNCLLGLVTFSLILGGCNSRSSLERYSARQKQNLEEKEYRSTFHWINGKIIERIEMPYGYSYLNGSWINNYGEEHPGSSYYAPAGWP